MIRHFIFFCVLALSVAFALASPLPREMPFMVALAGFFIFPFRAALVYATIAGALMDVFSPVKGLSALAYAVGITVAALLHRTMLTNRSVLAFVILTSIASISVFAVKTAGMMIFSLALPEIDVLMLFSLDSMARLMWSFVLNAAMAAILYAILRACSRAHRL